MNSLYRPSEKRNEMTLRKRNEMARLKGEEFALFKEEESLDLCG